MTIHSAPEDQPPQERIESRRQAFQAMVMNDAESLNNVGQSRTDAAAAPDRILASYISDQGPEGYSRPDFLIIDDIARRLAADSEVEAAHVILECDAGDVVIAGTVPRRIDLSRLEEIAATTFGVREVDVSTVEIRRFFEISASEDSSGSNGARGREPAAIISQFEETEDGDDVGK